jgi:hypothetical protein
MEVVWRAWIVSYISRSLTREFARNSKMARACVKTWISKLQII